MIPIETYRDRAVAVLGLGRSGLATADALAAGGARVLAWDDDADRRAASEASGLSVSRPDDWAEIAALVPSPGVPLGHPMIGSARAAGIEILGDIELLCRALPAPRYIAVTGTNGKSTTTALIGHLLAAAGIRVQTGGNLGTPALALESAGADATLVLELSSYQLDLMVTGSFDTAVLLNIAPDHLDRHGSMEAYVAAKRRIFRPGRLKTAIIGLDDAESREIHASLAAQPALSVVSVTAAGRTREGVSVEDGVLFEAGDRVGNLRSAPALPGRHNWQNAAAAFAAGRACGLDPATLVGAMMTFPGLAHRMERIAEIDGIPFINDSKATNADAVAQALACYDRIYWIAGGRAKSGGVGALAPLFSRIAHAFLIGEAEAAFARDLAGRVPASRCGTLADAVPAAFAAARGDPGAVVLFSPACASFDQFANFEARGEAFRDAVHALAAQCPGEPRRCMG